MAKTLANGNITQVLEQPDEWAASYTADDQERVAELIDWLNEPRQRDRGWHRAAMARAASLNRGLVHQVIAGTYPSSPTRALEAMTDVMRREDERRRDSTDGVVVETSVYRLVAAACHRAHVYRNFSVVSAFVGTGKTLAVKRYAAEHDNAFLLEPTPDMTANPLLSELAEVVSANVAKTNRYGQGTKAERMRGIIRALKGTDSLLILDEAETVTPQTLEYIRRIRDLAGIGIVLTGTGKLKPMLKDPRGRFGQISSRVGFWPPIVRGITEDDAHRIVRAHLHERDDLTDEVLDAYWQMCAGSARVLAEDLIPGVYDYGLRKGKPLTPELVFQVGQDVLGFDRPRGWAMKTMTTHLPEEHVEVLEIVAGMMFPDEYIDFWACEYRRLEIHRRGITFESFVQYPHEILEALGYVAPEPVNCRCTEEHRPLLPEQRAVQQRLDAERGIDACPRRGGAIIEPLHHHRYPRRWFHADFRRRRRPGGDES